MHPIAATTRAFFPFPVLDSFKEIYENEPFNILHPTSPPRNAYAVLFADLFKGDKRNFVDTDGLLASWDIWTDLLHATEAEVRREKRHPPVYLVPCTLCRVPCAVYLVPFTLYHVPGTMYQVRVCTY